MTNDEDPILYAQSADGRFRFIEDVPNGDACGCVCPACAQPMRARNAGLKRRHSFAHQPGFTCTWAVETVLAMLAKQAIEEAGVIALPALSYYDAMDDEAKLLSDAQLMRVVKVETVYIEGRKAPCLVVTVQGGNHTAQFALCVSLQRQLTESQADELYEDTRGVITLDLSRDLQAKRVKLGKHYNRHEVVLSYQATDFIASVLKDRGNDLMSWVRNATRDAYEARSLAEKAEAEARQREEEEARRKEAEERAATVAREGIVREPDERVTSIDMYDVRQWPDKPLPQGVSLASYERYVQNGLLEAMIVEKSGLSSLTIRTEMVLDAIREVSWHLEELTRGFDHFALALDARTMLGLCEATLCARGDGSAELVPMHQGYEYAAALQGLVARNVAVAVFAPGSQKWAVDHVDVPNGRVILR